VRFPCFSLLTGKSAVFSNWPKPPGRSFTRLQTPAPSGFQRAQDRWSRPPETGKCFPAEQGRTAPQNREAAPAEQGPFSADQGWAASKPSSRRCACQQGEILAFKSSLSMSDGGWRPSNTAFWMSGARKASRTSLHP